MRGWNLKCREQAVKSPDSTQQQQIFKRHLRVVDTFRVFTVSNAMTRNLQSLTHGIEMKTDNSRGESY